MRSSATKDTVSGGTSGIDRLLEVSARIGRDTSLVQASTGNTSIKLDGTLWVKASGKWLADAEREQVLIPVPLDDCLYRLERGEAIPVRDQNGCRSHLRPSVETFMHAVLPQRVVIHVHAVNTVATALRSDAPACLADMLAGLEWEWIPYVASGLPLARAVHEAYTHSPATNIFVLGNHGLVVCGESCAIAEDLLRDVERRLAVQPRVPPKPDFEVLEQIEGISRWRLPDSETIHCFGTDPIAQRILVGGILTPCQAVFLGRNPPLVASDEPVTSTRKLLDHVDAPFVIIKGVGVLINGEITRAEYAILRGFAEVVQRLPNGSRLHYLSEDEIDSALQAEGLQYKQSPDNRVKAIHH